MASVEDIKRQLEVATTQYERCVEELKEFRKSEEGNRLSELKNKMRGKKWTDTEEKEAWTQEKEELEEELKELKVDKNKWIEEMQKWAEKLRAATDDTEIERPPKRSRYETDKTKFLCENLIQSFDTLPTHAGQLLDLINAPLLAKLPVLNYSDLGKFAQIGDSIYFDEIDRESELATVIRSALSETSFTKIKSGIELVPCVDILIVRLLTFLCEKLDFQIEFSRIKTEKISKGIPVAIHDRPDLLGYVKDVLVIKNEERAARNDLETAKEELIANFSKLDPLYFGNIQFLICFVVAKDIMCFYAIDGPSKTLVPLSTELYLDDIKARYKAVKICINIVRILKTMITKNAFPAKVIPLGRPLELGNSTITFFEEYVEKAVLNSRLYGFGEDDDRVDTLKLMYEVAKGHHGLVQLLEGPIFEVGRPGEYIIKLKTRGLERPPKDEQTTRVMTCSLLTGLKRLHQKDYVHRDICLSNIIYDSNNSQGYEYVLIDFEHGGKINEKFDILLINWDDGTLDKNNLYTTLSDMYQLGKLLEELNTVFSSDGQDFISKLKKKMLEADAALQHPWIASI
ncbi:hypothetical protein G9A89_004064 [Geosiphon pyriformis]|nr:hypothetical protein G9A89_004064 [Geosiphon pyriformis]